MKKAKKDVKKIAVYGGGWRHNVGNAFIQLGCIKSLEQAFPNAKVLLVDNGEQMPPRDFKERLAQRIKKLIPKYFSKIFLRSRKNNIQQMRDNMVKIPDLIDFDYIVLSGVWLSEKYLKSHKKYLMKSKKEGVKIVLNGVGGSLYTDEEVDEVRKLLEEIDPHVFISRDNTTYENYKDVVGDKKSFDGIDLGFFLSSIKEDYSVRSNKEAYSVLCFDKVPVPADAENKGRVIRTHHSLSGLKKDPYLKPDTIFSELVNDYLTLYANCQQVRSDRVHACVAALAFGNKAKLDYETPRAELFDVVGGSKVRDKVSSLDMGILSDRKKEQVEILRKSLES